MKKSLSKTSKQHQKETRPNYKGYVVFFIIILLLGIMVMQDVVLPRPLTLSIALIGFFGLLLSAFFQPLISLLALTAYMPFSIQFVGQFGSEIVGLNLTNILMLIAFIAWGLQALSHKDKIFGRNSLNVLIIVFALWGLMTIFRSKFIYGYSYQTEDFMVLFKRWITPMCLFFISFNMVKSREDFKKVLFVILLVTFVIALMAMRDYIHYGDRGSMEESRIGGVFNQANMLGAFFVYNMFFFLAFFLYYWRSFKYWLVLVPFLICFRGIMVTFSRGAYMAAVFGGYMAAFFRSKILFLVASFILVFMLLNPIFIPEGIRERMASTFGGDKVVSTDIGDITDASAGNRLLVWQGAMAMIKAEPIFGFGYGTFRYIIGLFAPKVAGYDPHNTYLMIAAEMGLPALLLFLLILFILIKNARWLLRHAKDKYFKAFAIGMLGGLFGLIVANIFGSRLNSEEVSSYFWLLSGLLMRAVVMRRQKQIA